MLIWPARIVTADATYDPAHFRGEHGGRGELLDKAGALIASLDGISWLLVAEGAQTGQVNVTQRWQVTGSNGERWLVELTKGCGCGGTRVTGSNPLELQW